MASNKAPKYPKNGRSASAVTPSSHIPAIIKQSFLNNLGNGRGQGKTRDMIGFPMTLPPLSVLCHGRGGSNILASCSCPAAWRDELINSILGSPLGVGTWTRAAEHKPCFRARDGARSSFQLSGQFTYNCTLFHYYSMYSTLLVFTPWSYGIRDRAYVGFGSVLACGLDI
jgi:hypothetical protein